MVYKRIYYFLLMMVWFWQRKKVNELQTRFEITGDPNIFVGMQIVRDRENKRIFLHQRNYIHRILKRCDWQGMNGVCTPIEKGMQLTSMSVDENFLFREAIGS